MLVAFPAGPIGAALLLLRVAGCGHVVLLALSPRIQDPVAQLGLAVLALAILLGLFARVAVLAGAVACAAVCTAALGASWTDTAMNSCQAIALALAGPGAVSIDAVLFGRRVINLEG